MPEQVARRTRSSNDGWMIFANIMVSMLLTSCNHRQRALRHLRTLREQDQCSRGAAAGYAVSTDDRNFGLYATPVPELDY